jgi:hypothetical protein
LSVLSAAVTPPAWSQKANPDALLIQDFEDRVKDYVRLHKQVEATLPALKPTVSPEIIAHHEHELGERIRAARRGAVQGNVFTPKLAAELRRLISIAMQGSDATHVQQSLQHAEPVKLRLQVGATYPTNLPLQSTPPTLLLNLPPLPPEVDYRIVAKDLVLRDVRANLIVDFVSNAIP